MTHINSITDAIRQRSSCRNYLERPIAAETRRQLVEFMATTGAGPFGSRPRFELVAASEADHKALRGLGTYGFIRGATGFIVGMMPPGDKALEDFGYQMERIILHATQLGLGTCWLGGTFTKSSFARKVRLQAGEIIPCVTSTGYPAGEQHLLESVIRGQARADRRKPWERLFFDGSFDRPLSPSVAGEYATALEMVRLAPSASNKQPWRVVKDGDAWHFYLRRTPGYREGMLVRLVTVADLQRIDMGIAMCHFELSARELGLPGRWTTRTPSFDEPASEVEYTITWAP